MSVTVGHVPDRARWLDWLAEAARAPSPHNIQPARWRCRGDRIELWEDTRRWLSAGDASGRDNRIALGMAWEALAIAMSRDGLGLGDPVLASAPYPPLANGLRLVAETPLVHDVGVDALVDWQTQRQSWRGLFPVGDQASRQRLTAILGGHDEIVQRVADDRIELIATLHDRATLALLENPVFAAELYRWMRFAGFGRSWYRDGLSAACLGMPLPVGWGAGVAMRPRMQRLLARIGVLEALVSERAQTMSAASLVAIHCAGDVDPLVVGRHWYRFWLALAAGGFAAVPMSAVVDEPAVREALLAAIALPTGRRLVNLMRVGPVPERTIPVSARLPVSELLL